MKPKDTPPEFQPIARHTRFHTQNRQPSIALETRAQLQQTLRFTPSQASQLYFPKALLALCSNHVIELSMPVLNAEKGETLEYRQLQHHPKYQKIWEESYCNELGCLCKGIGTGFKGLKKQRVAGTETFKFIRCEDVPANRRKKLRTQK